MKKKKLLLLLTVVLTLCVSIVMVACYNNSSGGTSFDGGAHKGEEVADSASSPIVTTTDRMIVYTVEMNLSVKNKTESINNIKTKLQEVGGYEESSYTNNDGYGRYVFRVPTSKLDEFVNSIEKTGELNNKSVSSEDITEKYTTVLAKKNALQTEYDALSELISGGTLSVSETLSVYEQLRSIASQLDLYTTELTSYKNQSEYSTVMISIYAEGEYVEPSYWDNLGNTFLASGNSIGTVFGWLLTALVAIAPYFALLVGIFGLYVLIKFIVCKITKKPFALFKNARARAVYRKERKEFYANTVAKTNKKSAEGNKSEVKADVTPIAKQQDAPIEKQAEGEKE